MVAIRSLEGKLDFFREIINGEKINDAESTTLMQLLVEALDLAMSSWHNAMLNFTTDLGTPSCFLPAAIFGVLNLSLIENNKYTI